MPEGATYSDMARRLSVADFSTEYELRIFPEFFVKEQPGKWKTIEGMDSLLKLTNGHKLTLAGAWIESYGKELGVPLILTPENSSSNQQPPETIPSTTTYLRAHFALHGVRIPMLRTEFEEIVKKDLEVERVRIQVAFIGPKHCIIFSDNNKLCRFWFEDSVSNGQWWNCDLGPCPIRFPDRFQQHLRNNTSFFLRKSTSIIEDLTNSNIYFNGIGTSHAAEILFLANIHPEMLSKDIFRSTTLLDRLLVGITEFFETLKSDRYLKYVPTTSTANRGFENAPSITIFYNQFTKVYRKSSVRVELTRYNFLHTNGLLEERFQPLSQDWEQHTQTESGRPSTKIIPVYKLSFLSQKALKQQMAASATSTARTGPSKSALATKSSTKSTSASTTALRSSTLTQTSLTSWLKLSEAQQLNVVPDPEELSDAFQNETTALDEEDIDSPQVNKRSPKIKPRFSTYTTIFQHPYPANSKYRKAIQVPNDSKNTLNHKGNIPELGITSFLQTKEEDKKRKADTLPKRKKVSIKTGKRGRPVKRAVQTERDNLQ